MSTFISDSVYSGAHPGSDDVETFQSVGISHHVLATGLSLTSGQLVYISVKGKWVSDTGSSNNNSALI